MDFDTQADTRVAEVALRLQESGAVALLHSLISTMWAANVARFDSGLGDTALSLGIQCSENLASQLYRRRQDSDLTGTGLVVRQSNKTTFCTFEDATLRFVKAPVESELQPDWSDGFSWNSHVRQEAALLNDQTYRAPKRVPGIEPLIDASGTGNAGQLNQFFIIWNGLRGELPLTAGWLTIPSLHEDLVIGVKELWRDAPSTGGVRVPSVSDAPHESAAEPTVSITLKKNLREAQRGK
ncbi:hypothetical protein [uncultured Plantibacter sp.]|uniref:hypothetical protein n=1 Tax=uncultured Plantibacter sp. TaxID=293337 RepID=UPI0028D1A40E|nr:hypothetical protein [uncultured Plantibacter sp.]